MKKIVSLLLVTVLLVGFKKDFVQATTRYGFSYDTSVYNVEWKSMYSFNVYSEAGGKLGTCSYVVGLTREKRTDDYVLMMREIMTPNNSKVTVKGALKGYGFSEYVSAKVTLPSLDDYEPQNTPSTDTVSLSIGASKDGASVEASYDITHSDLDITASCNTTSKMYFVKYNYIPSQVNPFADNKYLANESIQLGAAAFHTSNAVSFKMNYDARFGAASDNAASPWNIYPNHVYKNTCSRNYTFSVKK